jgi:hypothetical protein
MPFAPNTDKLVGRELLIAPDYGYGWFLVDESPTDSVAIDLPNSFTGVIADMLTLGGTCRGLRAKCEVEIAENVFHCLGIIPRTDAFVELTNLEIFCNILLSSSPSVVFEPERYPELVHLGTTSTPYVIGFAQVKLTLR